LLSAILADAIKLGPTKIQGGSPRQYVSSQGWKHIDLTGRDYVWRQHR